MADSPKLNAVQATTGAVHRTIPSSAFDVTLSAGATNFDLRPYAGKWIYLRAIGANCSVLRRASALTAINDGYPINTTDSIPQEFFVDAGDSFVCQVFGTGSGTLRVYFD